MDLFDKDKHFAHLVPLKALRDALLRNAIAAVAAKQLGRVKGHKLFGANQCQKPAMVRHGSPPRRYKRLFADIYPDGGHRVRVRDQLVLQSCQLL